MKWVNATDLKHWADTRECQGLLPQLLRRLVHATVGNVLRCDFSSGESVQLGGWDGLLHVNEGNPYVPTGLSAWEIGAEKRVTAKANDDYRKRTSKPEGVDRPDTSFVFVTPRAWRNKRKWEKRKNSRTPWKNVRGYNADDLEQWLELAPSVAVWLGTLLGKPTSGTRSIEEYWDKWSSATNPALSIDLLAAGREAEGNRICEWLNERPSVIAVQGDTDDEAVAFLCSTLLRMAEVDRERHLARTIIVSDSEALRMLAPSRSALVIVLQTTDESDAGWAERNGHHVFIPLGREPSGSRKTFVSLPRLSRSAFQQALREMGIQENEARSLSRDTGRALPVLRRHLGRSRSYRSPRWAQPENARDIIPPLLAGTWNESKQGDQAIITRLAGCETYVEVSRRIMRWANASDPPLRQIGEVWKITAHLDAFFALAPHLTRTDLQVFEETVIQVLGQIDPRFELPPDQRFASAIYGKVLPHSEGLREGISETLTIISTFGIDAGLNTGSVSPERWASGVVRKLLREAQGQLWSSLSPHLPQLAEAASDSFLEAVEAAMLGDTPPIKEMFSEEGLFGSSPHTGLLWALEGLAWNPSLLSRVTAILGRLARLDPGGKLSNRPQNSLDMIFLPWFPRTRANPEQRLDAIDVLMKRESDIGWKLLVNLVPSTHGVISHPTHEPRWRDFAGGIKTPAPPEDVSVVVIGILDRIERFVGNNGHRWRQVIELFHGFHRGRRTALIRQLERFARSVSGRKDRLILWDALREALHRHREYSDTRWAMRKTELRELDAIYNLLEPQDLIDRYRWLFNTHWPHLPKGFRGSHAKEEAAIRSARKDAVRHIFKEGGIDGLIVFAKRSQLPDLVGHILALESFPQSIVSKILNRSLEAAGKALQFFACGYIRGRHSAVGWEWTDTLFKKAKRERWPPKTVLRFSLALPVERQSWDRISVFGERIEREYWQRVGYIFLPRGRDEDVKFAAAKLLKEGRPIDAFIAAKFSPAALPWGLLVEILRGVSKAVGEGHEQRIPDSYYVQKYFEAMDVDEAANEDEIAQLEWIYLPLLTESKRQLRLHGILTKDPNFFGTLICWAYPPDKGNGIFIEGAKEDDSQEQFRQRARRARDVLDSWHVVPGATQDDKLDEETLWKWIVRAREVCAGTGHSAGGEHRIGRVLAHSPEASDGVWPAVEVRNIIERADSDEMGRGIMIGLYNKRGITSRGFAEGGGQERVLAAQYRRSAQAVASSWPRTSTILERMAVDYDREAHWEDSRAELMDLEES